MEPDIIEQMGKYRDNLVARKEVREMCARAIAEIIRLRSALSQIADSDAHHDGAARFMEIARSALTTD